jgi:organic hydroperoxide reductase OsmC/OhrA
MEISANLQNGRGAHRASVSTAGSAQQVAIPPKDSGQGSAVNGGELLMLALATCYCNDLSRAHRVTGAGGPDRGPARPH